MLTDRSNLFALNCGREATRVLPPECGGLYNHKGTVIFVPNNHVGIVRSPEGISEVFITVGPDPVFFLAYKNNH
jgi:hypothetical protein